VPTLTAAACADLLDPLSDLAAAAALEILEVGRSGAQTKADGSPVTPADEAAELLIRKELRRLIPELPIISEEQAAQEIPKVPARGSYFLVDPLDGTSDFIAGRDEYTVNIALMTDGAPVFGVIAAPASSVIWRGIVGRGAQRIEVSADGRTVSMQAIRTRSAASDNLTVMVSRSHLEARTKAYVDGLPVTELVRCGSSIKFCRLAEGAADLYARLAPTHDWDIAAGHAILAAAGGTVMAPNGAPIAYGSEDLLIPAFLAWGDPARAAPVKD